MKNMKRILLTMVAAMLLVVMSVAGTLAYLTSQSEQVNNTFTVGKVDITLDETDVDLYGVKDGETRVLANEYKLIAGHTYTKDPQVHVLAGSEPSYVRIFVSINDLADLAAACNVPEFWPHAFVSGWKNEIWEYKSYTGDAGARVYEFWYVEDRGYDNGENSGAGIVDARNGQVNLPALFTSFTLPETATNEEILALEDLEIKVIAQAVQADTLTMAEAFNGNPIAAPTFAPVPTPTAEPTT